MIRVPVLPLFGFNKGTLTPKRAKMYYSVRNLDNIRKS